jgi:hypothetical protein
LSIVSTRFNSSFKYRFSSASCAAVDVAMRFRFEPVNVVRVNGGVWVLFKKWSYVRIWREVLRLSSSSSSSCESTSSRR